MDFFEGPACVNYLQNPKVEYYQLKREVQKKPEKPERTASHKLYLVPGKLEKGPLMEPSVHVSIPVSTAVSKSNHHPR